MKHRLYQFYDGLKANSLAIISSLIAVAGAFLLMTLINVNVAAARDAKDTKEILKTQQLLLTNLDKAVKDLKADNQQKLNILICMALVPQSQRTTDVAENCRKQVETLAQPSPSATTAPNTSQTSSNQINTSSSQSSAGKEQGGDQKDKPKKPTSIIPGVEKCLLSSVTLNGACL